MDTTEIFQQLNRAYEVLKDRDLRTQFDRFGSDGIGNSYASDSSVRSQNVRKPDEVYYHSEANPFGTYMGQPPHVHDPFQGPPPPQTEYEPGVFYHPPQPPFSRRPGDPYAGSPFDEPWDPWRSSFADVYDSRMGPRDVGPESFGTSSFKGRDERYGFGDVNTGHQRIQTDFRNNNVAPPRSRTNDHINTGHQQVQTPEMPDGHRATHRTAGPSRQYMGDIANFDALRSKVHSPPGTRRRWVGDDLCIEIEIDYETATKGGEEKVRIKRLETCSTCEGDGIQPGAEVKTCEHCGGSGAVLHKAKPVGMGPTDNFSGHQVCRHCRGTGQSVAENCGSCHGKGTKQTTKDMTLVIPPGVTEGSKLRLKGEGDAGPMGGPAGDLFIFLKFKSAPSTNGTRRP
jgi:DnaJ-class molecular chaperone